MSLKNTTETILNPRCIEHPVREGAIIATGTLIIAGMCISGWLHRGIHGGVEYSETAKKGFRKINFLTTGMTLTDWVVHLAHHNSTEKYNKDAHDEWNANRPEGAPEAPKEAFRDPYSSIMEGFLNVKFKTSGMHRKAKKAIQPWLFKLDSYDKENGIEDREHWPNHFKNVDLEEGDPSKIRNRAPYLGLVALGTTIAAARSPKTALTWTAIHVPMLMNLGGFINAEAHTGQKSGFINRAKVMLGLEEPIPDADGEYAANILPGNEGIFFGEPSHNRHHHMPYDPFLVGRENTTIRRDPPGMVIKLLEKIGHATTPGSPT